MFTWPNLELTDEERKKYSTYKTKDKGGVLHRIYRVVLNSQEVPDKGFPVIKTSGQLQIARRTRVFGLTYSGNLDRWRLGITNVTGTNYTAIGSRDRLPPVVSSMLPGYNYNALSLGALVPPIVLTSDVGDGIGPAIKAIPAYVSQGAPVPHLIEPNWVLMPNETLIFNGIPLPVQYDLNNGPQDPNLILTIGIHCWEFPLDSELPKPATPTPTK